MRTVYFISGLGADERAFGFLDLSFCKPVFVKWIKPGKDESIAEYARRLKAQISDDMPVLVGLSFGGMIAIEIARQFPCSKVILLSSAKSQYEIPLYLRFMRHVPLHKLAGPAFIRSANHFAYRLMGIQKRWDKILFTEMLKDADDDFINWAIHQIINWKNVDIPDNIIHIHGNKDIVLPYRYIKADYTVSEGEHLMVMSKPAAITALLQEIIDS